MSTAKHILAIVGHADRTWTAKVNRHAALIRWSSTGLFVISLFLLARALPVDRGVEALKGWVDGLSIWGALMFGACYVAAALVFIPVASNHCQTASS